MFVVFEGMDCTGKSTIIKELCAYYTQNLKPFLATRQPYFQTLKNYVSSREYDLNYLSQLLIFAADSIQHLNSIVLPELADNKIVLCDRLTFFSAQVYQLYANNIKADDFILDVLAQSVCNRLPDITFVLQPPKEVIKQRLEQRKSLDKFEYRLLMDEAFFNRIYDAYELIAIKYKNVEIIRETNFNEIINRVLDKIM